VLATGADFLFVCKKDGHKTLYEFIEGAPLEERTVTERKPGKRSLTYRYRWMEAVPLRDGKGALNVNWLSVTITNEKGKTTYDGAFVTSLPITAENVVETAACAPARWKTRERKLQRAEEQRLQFGPQLRPRQEIPGKNVRRHELAGLRLPHRLRLHGNPLATSTPDGRHPQRLLSRPAHHHRLPPLALTGHSFISAVLSGKAPPI
jgi:hypothetical protein